METVLNTPLRFEGRELPNRVVLQPMEGCDCMEDGTPGELTREKYLRAARSGAGIIWMEACAVCPEGRTNPGQLMLTEKNLPQFKALLADMRQAARESWGGSPLLLCQLLSFQDLLFQLFLFLQRLFQFCLYVLSVPGDFLNLTVKLLNLILKSLLLLFRPVLLCIQLLKLRL